MLNTVYIVCVLKVSVFENGHFNRHLIFYKKMFLGGEKTFLPLLCFFGEFFFEKIKKKINFLKFWKKKIFVKIFPKKLFKKKNNAFFQKDKVLVYQGKQIVVSQKNFFCKKLSVRQTVRLQK